MYKYNLSLHYLKSPGHVDGFDRQKAHSYTNYIINNDIYPHILVNGIYLN